MAIEPERLVLADEPGLDTLAASVAAEPGIHVVIGRNNAGKTRLLRALALSRFGAKVLPRDHQRRRKFDHNGLSHEWSTLPSLDVVWGRDRPNPDPGFPVGHVPGSLMIEDRTLQAIRRDKPGLDDEFFRHVLGELWVYLRWRPATVVPTDRYFRHSTRLMDGFVPDEPAGWAAELTRLANGAKAEDREIWRAMGQGFSDVTEGLKLQARLSGEEVVVQVEDGNNERPLNLCGDGLRDLASILFFAARWPRNDLMLDEPGLRLHPHAQRRLLQHLERESKERAIWIASHDGVFVGAPSAKRRFFVDRKSESDSAEVSELATREDGRQALELLGWAPSDAFLADRIVLGEGLSDRVAFSAAINWLAEVDVTWGGTVVLDLGGEGAASARRPELRMRLELLRRVAPHASAHVLLDRDRRSATQVQELEAWFSDRDFPVRFLSRPVLEDFWLAPAVVKEIVDATVRQAAARGHEVKTPNQAAVEQALTEETKEGRVGSEILEAVMKRFALRFSKTLAADVAIDVLRSLAVSDADGLMADLQALRV